MFSQPFFIILARVVDEQSYKRNKKGAITKIGHVDDIIYLTCRARRRKWDYGKKRLNIKNNSNC